MKKRLKTLKDLSPYTIEWCILILDKKISKMIMKKLNKIFFHEFYGKFVLVRHSGNKMICRETQQIAIKVLQKYNKHGVSVIITDKQFPLIKISGKIIDIPTTKMQEAEKINF